MRSPPLRGRGVPDHPPGRFERLVVEPDPDARDLDDETPDPRTEYLKDASRSVLSHNQSPDVGFEWSLNPYRGCEHGCVYCARPETPILHADMTWRPIGDVNAGDELVAFDEFPEPGRTRKLRKAVVEAVWWSRRPTLRLVTEATEVVATAEHRWLQVRDFRWSRTEQLSPGRSLRSLPVTADDPIDDDYRAGYIAGMSLGDGTFRYEPGWRGERHGFPAAYWRVALVDDEPLVRLVDFLRCFGVDVYMRPFSEGSGNRKPLRMVQTRSIPKLAILHTLITAERDTRSYRRGFLGGFFDAEGHNGDSLRISQVDLSVLERVRKYAGSLGFEFQLERYPGKASNLRLLGRLVDRIRFFSVCRPAIARKMEGLLGQEMNLDPDPVRAVEPGRRADVVDIQTSTGTFLAAGLATHNCYARPTHEYLGLSAGLDFETRILVKEDAPALLRRALTSESWKPRLVALSGVTDPYQPVERRLRLTRGCLEVLAELRNPVAVITKSRLVTRDVDLLGELARHRAVGVTLSITTLDPDLARRMEPRAAQPRARLAAVEALARSGIPVGVNVAPVIPGLNDHEIPAILEAAAAAGAGFAAYVMLRLPHGVKDLFERWLEDHYPERREKVLHRIREVRGGRLNDPRFGSRMRGSGPYAVQLGALFQVARRRAGLSSRGPELSTAAFQRQERQLALL